LGEILEWFLHRLLHQLPSTHHRAIRAQLATLRHFPFHGQLDDPFIEFLQGLRLNQVCPADQGRVIWHIVEIDPAERSQTQAISHRSLRLFIAVAIQPLHDPHPPHDIDWRGIPSRRLRLWISLRSIHPDHPVQFLILQIPIALLQFR